MPGIGERENMRFLADLVLIAIILMCVWSCYKKGLVVGISIILAIVVSVYMGDLLSDTFSHEAEPVLRPFISGYMDGSEGVINKSMEEITGTELKVSIEDALAKDPSIKYELAEKSYINMGIYSSSAKEMSIKVAELADREGITFSNAIVDVFCSNIVYILGFILFFIITMIILTVVGNVVNLNFAIPGMQRLDKIGGAAAGLIAGFMFCIVVVWVLKFSGRLFPEEDLSRTLITALFLKMNILSGILSV